MVLSTASQPPETYTKWRRFTFPTDNGPKDSVAVPNWVANQLNAAYSTMINLMMIHFWSIVVGAIVYIVLVRHKMKPKALHPLAPTLWNKRSDLIDSMFETFTHAKPSWKELWVTAILVLVFVAWVGQTAMGVLVPPLLILGNGAPVEPTAIYVPDSQNAGNDRLLGVFSLDVPPALRALGAAQVANQQIRERVQVSTGQQIGTFNNSEPIMQYSYSYKVTGRDLGLQRALPLTLEVTGSCKTEYDWFLDTIESGGALVDRYRVLGANFSVSLFDGRQPIAFFRISGNFSKGTLERSNSTMAIVISSARRTSFGRGDDPWYLTEVQQTRTGAAHVVKAARPVLSCWQDDVWSYGDAKTTLDIMSDQTLPGLGLSSDLVALLGRRLRVPMLWNIGFHLQASALASATTALNQIFDAGASSIYLDLERLVLASYIATSNVLTDTTLYPPGSDTTAPNFARTAAQTVKEGVDAFVVYSADVTALDMVVLIAIPTVFVGVWILSLFLFYWTPLGAVNALDSNNMYMLLADKYPDSVVKYTEDGAEWHLNGLPLEGNQDIELAQKPATAGTGSHQDDNKVPQQNSEEIPVPQENSGEIRRPEETGEEIQNVQTQTAAEGAAPENGKKPA